MLSALTLRFVSALNKWRKAGGVILMRMGLGVLMLAFLAGCHTAPAGSVRRLG